MVLFLHDAVDEVVLVGCGGVAVAFNRLLCSGFGDIVPRQFVSQVLTSLQMLSSVVYSVAIFAVGTTYIRIKKELHAQVLCSLVHVSIRH